MKVGRYEEAYRAMYDEYRDMQASILTLNTILVCYHMCYPEDMQASILTLNTILVCYHMCYPEDMQASILTLNTILVCYYPEDCKLVS